MRPANCTCGARYADMRTGLTFADVRQMLFVASDDPSQWRNRRRNGVLGFWHELKLMQWEQLHGSCR